MFSSQLCYVLVIPLLCADHNSVVLATVLACVSYKSVMCRSHVYYVLVTGMLCVGHISVMFVTVLLC